MKVAAFSKKSYDKFFLEATNSTHRHELTFIEPTPDSRDERTGSWLPGSLRVRQ